MAGMQEFGALIKRAREDHGWSGVELATALGRPHSFVVRWETGKFSNPPDPQSFADFSRVLRLPREDMLIALGYLERDAGTQEDTDNPRTYVTEVVNRYEWDEEDALWVVDFIEMTMKRKRRG